MTDKHNPIVYCGGCDKTILLEACHYDENQQNVACIDCESVPIPIGDRLDCPQCDKPFTLVELFMYGQCESCETELWGKLD